MPNPAGKTRKVEEPYEVWSTLDGTWEWRVLKKYQMPEREAKNEYARWFCAVRSPMTYGAWEYGDVYVSDIKRYAVRVDGDG